MARRQALSPTNRLLDLLPAATLKRLGKNFEEVALSQRQDLSPATRTHVYFPLTGMISLVPRLADGTMIEVGLIGHEGFLGVPVLLAGRAMASAAMVQGKGGALRMETVVFLAAVRRDAVLRDILLRYADTLLEQITRTAICNARHSLSQRLARWLLEAHDRTLGDELPLSHELLAMMLGTRRSGVTVAIGAFRKKRLLTGGHGSIGLRDRRGLEQAACECYRAVRDRYTLLFPGT